MLRHVARRLAATLVGVGIGITAGAGPGAAAEIEDYASYDPQTECVSTVQPGTNYLLDWLVRKYPNTDRSGLLRPCTSGGTSEHKDGRALDWTVDAALPGQRASAASFLAKIFATDAAGNPHARARRMGIMYIIWNDQLFGSYRMFEKRDYLSPSCQTRRTCSKTLRHRDHMHISLSHAGAEARTSFYVRRNVLPAG